MKELKVRGRFFFLSKMGFGLEPIFFRGPDWAAALFPILISQKFDVLIMIGRRFRSFVVAMVRAVAKFSRHVQL